MDQVYRTVGGGTCPTDLRALHVPDEITSLDIQAIGDDFESSQGHAQSSILQPIKMGAVQAGAFCQIILSDAFRLSDLLDPLAYGYLNVLQASSLGWYAALKHPA